MTGETPTPQEVLESGAWEQLEGEGREKFVRELGEYVQGLRDALADPDLDEELRAELAEQLEGLSDAYEGVKEGGEIKMEK